MFKRTIITASFSSFLVIAVCAVLGLKILEFFNISLASFQVGGGMLLLCQSIAPAQAASATPAQSHAASAPQAATQAIPTPAAEQPAWGILPATAHMHSRLQGLGLQALVEPAVTAAGGAQELDNAQATGAQGAEPQHPPLRGHTFHYASISTALPELARTTSARAGRDRA